MAEFAPDYPAFDQGIVAYVVHEAKPRVTPVAADFIAHTRFAIIQIADMFFADISHVCMYQAVKKPNGYASGCQSRQCGNLFSIH